MVPCNFSSYNVLMLNKKSKHIYNGDLQLKKEKIRRNEIKAEMLLLIAVEKLTMGIGNLSKLRLLKKN